KSAETRLAWPVFRPRLLAQVTVRVVLDGGVSMAVWEPLALELQRVLASSQAFRQVLVQRLEPSHLNAPERGGGVEEQTTVILLLSDSAGHHWWDGTIHPWLESKTHSQPLVLIHTLPPRYWATTALSQAEQVTFSNRIALAPNSRYEVIRRLPNPWDPPEPADAEPEDSALRLPMITLDRRELGSWAALVAGEPRARCVGRVLTKTGPPAATAAEEAEGDQELSQAEAESLWQVFESRASPEAQDLLMAMAASPVLTLPILRLLQAAEAPRAFSPQPLAEVLVSGLVRRLERQGDDVAPEHLQFELLPAVRRLLEPRLSPERHRQVLASVTDLLERHWNKQGTGTSFKALLLGPKDVLKEEHPDLFHIANVTAAMLDSLPGQQFRELAAQLRGRDSDAPPGSPWPSSMVFDDAEFETAQLVDVPPLETIPFTTARFAEAELGRISFKTATLQPDLTPRFFDGEAWAFHDPLQRDRLPFGATAEKADPLALTLVEIPAGTFQMGSPPDEPERSADEGPQHEVTLQSFFISQTPITQAQWRQVAQWSEQPGEHWGRDLKPNPSNFSDQPDSDQRPVEQVSWRDAMEFSNRLSQRTGRFYTLPSEAQWEVACRAGTTTPFAFGETLSNEVANDRASQTYGSGSKGNFLQQTTPVGMFPANAWGLQDMHGNVWEWCLDHWHDSYEGAPTDGSAWLNPTEPNNKAIKKGDKGTSREEEVRLLRGGSWYSLPWDCRSANRLRNEPGYAYDDLGFRVVCLPQGPSLNS
ncbi:MAG: SAV_2336 N-terminal domain-related protein, partial [Cyanobium sp.]